MQGVNACNLVSDTKPRVVLERAEYSYMSDSLNYLLRCVETCRSKDNSVRN